MAAADRPDHSMAIQPAFSIIVSTYNPGGHLPACLHSLRDLDYPAPEFEVIVVDDGSQPPVDVQAFEPMGRVALRVIRSPRNEGAASARNRGALHARGVYLAFIDDDCLPRPDWLKHLEKSYAAAPECVIGGRIADGAPLNPYSAASTAILDSVYRYYNSGPASARFLATGNIAVPAKLFRQLGGFNPEFRTSEDREFCERCLRSGIRLMYAPDAVVLHRHPLDFRSFWRRHYRYGRGACRFWRMKASGNGATKRFEPAHFYWRMLCSPFAEPRRPRAALLSGLIAISQVASALGLLSEWRQSAIDAEPRDRTEIFAP